ncbi:uncharacterized protein LOC62_01G000190 [Vanrija pseudolonga]|uniref:Pentacotripeptide-repeat region of PRORP domain-containing protein n=1 Tax=Vanrija pseudolonga TaxID=143232 RepID=A0AAF0XZ08_9TREE|nr:hypothetical protein LOC62_01G000190 [Vanrija pseudolonga]
MLRPTIVRKVTRLRGVRFASRSPFGLKEFGLRGPGSSDNAFPPDPAERERRRQERQERAPRSAPSFRRRDDDGDVERSSRYEERGFRPRFKSAGRSSRFDSKPTFNSRREVEGEPEWEPDFEPDFETIFKTAATSSSNAAFEPTERAPGVTGPPPATPPPRPQYVANTAPGQPDPSTFPLYRPEPEDRVPTEEEIMTKFPLDSKGLPSIAAIHKEAKTQIVEDAIRNVPEFDEEGLRAFYSSVVLSGAAEEVKQGLAQIEAPESHRHTSKYERARLFQELRARLEAPTDEQAEEGAPAPPSLIPTLPESTPAHIALTAALINLAPAEPRGPTTIPLGIVRKGEWQALLDSFAASGDATGAEVLLSTMERHGVLPTQGQLDQVVEVYAKLGDTAAVARLISDFENVGLEITDHHRDMLVSSYLNGPNGSSEAAISLLTASENISKPFPQSSYGVVLKHLTVSSPTTQVNSHSRALAWDLFAHMRFAAHPQPTRELYTIMINVCSDAREPQPERARDLWIEMTTEGDQIQPKREEFDAIIRALGSTKENYLEAYDLLGQMLGKHEEATLVPFEDSEIQRVISPWTPTIETFAALLEGTKRAGDLDRARWILNEVVDLSRAAAFAHTNSIKGPDAEMMAGVFQTYAAWNPPVTRKSVTRTNGEREEAAAEEAEADEDPTNIAEAEAEAESSTVGPQTSAEALAEAVVLFQQILKDTAAAREGPVSIIQHPFANVRLSRRLVNSYMSVQLKHAKSLADARTTFNETWAELAGSDTIPTSTATFTLRPNGWSYINVLDRCARGRLPTDDRAVAQEWGQEMFEAYRAWQPIALAALGNGPDRASARRRWLAGLAERQVEAAWSAGIRLAAIGEDNERGLALVKEFWGIYPPTAIRETYSPVLKPDLGVRMVDIAAVAEPEIPPHLLFDDVKVLHQHFVRDENWTAVKYLTFVATSYGKALETRRKWRIKGAGVSRELRKKREREGKLAAPRLRRGSLAAPVTSAAAPAAEEEED